MLSNHNILREECANSKIDGNRKTNKVLLRGRETICTLTMALRQRQKSRRINVRPQTGPQSAHLWWPAVAKLQADSVPIA